MTTELETIDSIIKRLESDDGIIRVKAREALVTQGKVAVPPLIEAMKNRHDWTRWEAVKTLADIRDSTATRALIDALEDHEFSIRWLAAEGLINIGSSSMEPLLKALIDRPRSSWLKEGAHHVLHDLREPKLRPLLKTVISAIEDVDSNLKVPIAAKSALDVIRQGYSKSD
ncbi:HEAT repeat domain-containing protein [Chloroflexota bacterium]